VPFIRAGWIEHSNLYVPALSGGTS
jgi:hypothetical protein